MKSFDVTGKLPKNEKKGRKEDKSVTVPVMFPDFETDAKVAMAEAIKSFGEKAILSNAWSAFVIDVQNAVRNKLAKGLSEADIKAALKDVKMGVALPRAAAVPTKDKLIAFAMSLTPAERAALIASIQAGKVA
jgi:hypothetical protein